MIRRRIHQGQVFVLTRRGWRLVLNGYIRTRKGWRKMRRRPGRQKQPPVFHLTPSSSSTPPAVPETATAMPPAGNQWRGKYNVLRTEHDEGEGRAVASGSSPSSEIPAGPRNSGATFKADRGFGSVKTFETQARLGGEAAESR